MSAQETFLIGFAMIIVMKIVVFILGFLTIRMGYKLISSGVEGNFKFAATLGGFKTDLASVSPGLLFVLLGVVLIGIAVYVDKSIEVKATRSENTSAVPETSLPPTTLSFPDSTEDNN